MTNVKKPLIFFTIAIFVVISIVLLVEWEQKMNNPMKMCLDNRACPVNWECCDLGCCAPLTASSTPHTDNLKEYTPSYLYDAWYTQWPVLFFLGLLGGIIICCLWCCICKRSPSADSFIAMISCSCCVPPRRGTEIDSAGSLYPPPRYSRCGSFHQAPPPYSEVQSKPDLYPLVITCAEGEGKAGGNYLMVHYFRNYVIRPPPGSLSATSTAESLNSSFICNAANEANSIVPPPYSCASTVEEYGPGLGCRRSMLRSMSSLTETRPPASLTPAHPNSRHKTTNFRENLLYSPVENVDQPYDLSLELLDCEMYCDGNCIGVSASPRSHQSPPNAENIVFKHDAYGMRHTFLSQPVDACDTPLQPMSPNQTSEDSLRRPTEERIQRRLDSVRRSIRKSSLYMPLSTAHPIRPSRISPGTRLSSRSAPATPCSNLVPNILNFTHRASRHSSRSSRLEEEYDALLSEPEQSRHMDHKF